MVKLAAQEKYNVSVWYCGQSRDENILKTLVLCRPNVQLTAQRCDGSIDRLHQDAITGDLGVLPVNFGANKPKDIELDIDRVPGGSEYLIACLRIQKDPA